MFFLGRYAPCGGTLCAVVGEPALGHTFFQITVPPLSLLDVVFFYQFTIPQMNTSQTVCLLSTRFGNDGFWSIV